MKTSKNKQNVTSADQMYLTYQQLYILTVIV